MIGIQYAVQHAESDLTASHLEDAIVTVDKITFDKQPEALKNGQNRRFEVSAIYKNERDTTKIAIGPGGAGPSETIAVQISYDGRLSANTYITCD